MKLLKKKNNLVRMDGSILNLIALKHLLQFSNSTNLKNPWCKQNSQLS